MKPKNVRMGDGLSTSCTYRSEKLEVCGDTICGLFIHRYCKEELVRDPSNFGCYKGNLDSTLVTVRWSDACRLNAIGAGRRVQSWRGSRPGWCFGRTSTRPLHERVDRRLQTRGGAWTLADLWCAGGTKCNIMEYLFVCSTIDSNMKNHLHCYRYQRLKYKFNYTSLVKFSYFGIIPAPWFCLYLYILWNRAVGRITKT